MALLGLEDIERIALLHVVGWKLDLLQRYGNGINLTHSHGFLSLNIAVSPLVSPLSQDGCSERPGRRYLSLHTCIS
jgi:hypothetical protein